MTQSDLVPLVYLALVCAVGLIGLVHAWERLCRELGGFWLPTFIWIDATLFTGMLVVALLIKIDWLWRP